MKYKDAMIIKPEGSKVYFESVEGVRDWFWQQLRVFVGVEKSFMLFQNEYTRLQSYFSWRYAENPKYRKHIRRIAIKVHIKLFLFRVFQKAVFIAGKKELKKIELLCGINIGRKSEYNEVFYRF
ncbi:hypothetical protein [Leuconostoc gasicomitatum]|nr:hypothetical protein [Leuconostoc gasicomitatum]